MNKIGTVILALSLVVLAFVPVPKQTETIVLEAEGFADIQAPMRVVPKAAASGEAYVELPLGSGQGWRGKGKGSVTYRVDIACEGDYTVWGRSYWQDGCMNALFLQASDGPRVVFGNDAIFKRWHWVKGPTLPLHVGVNNLTFSNHSDGTAIDKLLFTNDPLYLPKGLGEGITRFFDGFAGCDADNTGSWEFSSGKWRVVRAVGEGAGGVNDVLAQWSPDGGVAMGGFTVWHDYDMRAKIMLSGPGTVGLIFYHTDAENEFRLVWRAKEDGATMSLIRVANGTVETLAEAETASCLFDRWYELGFHEADGRMICTLDGETVLTAPSPIKQTGQIGLATKDSGGIYFDNVEARFRGESARN